MTFEAAVDSTGASIFVLGPEDTVLQKLRWFELGGRVSDRQWRDITSVLRVQNELDYDYMKRVALDAGLSELLELATRQRAKA